MKETTWSKHLPALLVALCLVVYNIIRVLKVPITHDEAETYWLYATASFKNITANIPVTANNHMLNSLVTKLSIGVFGHHIFFLRLGNIMAQLVYLAFAYKLCRRLFGTESWILLAFLLLNLNPFLFDFWGLCRGYGLSIALMIASMYYFVRFKIENDSGPVWAALILGVFSVYANFSALNYYVALTGVLVFWGIANKRVALRTVILPIIAISSGLYALVAHPLVELKNSGEFYFGSTDGLIQGTIASIVKESVFGDARHERYYNLISVLFIILFLAVGIFWGSQLFVRRVRKEVQIGFSVWGILLLVFLSLMVQFIMLGTPYIIERAALILYPLTVVSLIYWIYILELWKHARTSVIATIVALGVLVNFVLHTNTRAARSWQYNMHDKDLMEAMIAHQQQRSIKLKLYWAFIPSFRYNAKQVYPNHFQKIEKRGESVPAGTSYDYYYIHRDQNDEVPEGYVLLRSYEGGRYLFYGRR
jgi:hypothetical protein